MSWSQLQIAPKQDLENLQRGPDGVFINDWLLSIAIKHFIEPRK